MRLIDLYEDDDVNAPTPVPPQDVEFVHAYQETATLDASLLPELEARIAKLNKQAAKLGAEPITIEVVGTEFKEEKRGTETVKRKKLKVQIHGKPPKLAGWNLAARIEHMGEDALVHVVPGEDHPELRRFYKARPDHCDHCNTVRRRIDTFIVRNNAGEYKQVGRNCLREFLGGKDPKSILWYVSAYEDLEELLNAFAGRGGGGPVEREEYYRPFQDVLTAAVALANKYGYVSAKSEYKRPTSSLVRMALFSDPYQHDTHEEVEARHVVAVDSNSPNVQQEVRDILAWFQTIPSERFENEPYFHNLYVIKQENHVSSRNVGYVVGLIPTYRREAGKKATAAARSNVHVGEVGKKLPPTQVEVVGTRDIDSAFGRVQLVRFQDAAGNAVTWFNSGSDRDFQKGDKMTIMGTVKKHDQFKDRNQTVLTRVKVVQREERAPQQVDQQQQ